MSDLSVFNASAWSVFKGDGSSSNRLVMVYSDKDNSLPRAVSFSSFGLAEVPLNQLGIDSRALSDIGEISSRELIHRLESFGLGPLMVTKWREGAWGPEIAHKLGIEE